MLRSRWVIFYFLFFFVLTSSLLYINGNPEKLAISLLNLILVLSPLISLMFATMYYYNSREFTELLLAQPLPRKSIFFGQYVGLASSLSLCIVLGIIIPILIFNTNILLQTPIIFILILAGVSLTFIFSALAYLIALRNENRIRGFSYILLLWLFLAVLYDGLFLILLFLFKDYPLEKFALFSSLLNPIDLSRILILLKLETSALMGYTGAVFKSFFGSNLGYIVSFSMLVIWTIIPIFSFLRYVEKKNF